MRILGNRKLKSKMNSLNYNRIWRILCVFLIACIAISGFQFQAMAEPDEFPLTLEQAKTKLNARLVNRGTENAMLVWNSIQGDTVIIDDMSDISGQMDFDSPYNLFVRGCLIFFYMSDDTLPFDRYYYDVMSDSRFLAYEDLFFEYDNSVPDPEQYLLKPTLDTVIDDYNQKVAENPAQNHLWVALSPKDPYENGGPWFPIWFDLGVFDNLNDLFSVLITDPVDQTVNLGGTASFSVSPVDGAVVTYQWQKYNGSAWVNIPMKTAATLSISNVSSADDGSRYRCAATDSARTVYSDDATLTVLYPLQVNVRLDGAPRNGDFSVVLKKNDVVKETLTKSGTGTYAAHTLIDTYDVFVNDISTGQTITPLTDGTTQTLDINYYTVSYSVEDQGKASGSTMSAGISGSALQSGDIVPKGTVVTFSVTAAGADSYSYTWSGSGVVTQNSPTLNVTVNSALSLHCAVNGTRNDVTDGGDPETGDSAHSYIYVLSLALSGILFIILGYKGVKSAKQRCP